MTGQVIGKSLGNGFAGNYAKTPDIIIATKVAEVGNGTIKFGEVLMRGTAGNQVKKVDANFTNDKFVGIASAEVKTAYNYLNQDEGGYVDKEAVAVFQRGSISVICAEGTPEVGDDVFVAKTTNAFVGAEAGDLFAGTPNGTEGTDYIKLNNCQWGSNVDSNNVAELVLLTRVNA